MTQTTDNHPKRVHYARNDTSFGVSRGDHDFDRIILTLHQTYLYVISLHVMEKQSVLERSKGAPCLRITNEVFSRDITIQCCFALRCCL